VTNTRHLKRYATPKSWPITKKSYTWAPKLRPGPHRKQTALPLVLVLRDVLGLVSNTKEAKRVLQQGKVFIDGIIRKDHRFAVGLFDVITIPDIKKSWLVSLDYKGRLEIREVKNKGQKLVKITGKTTISGDKTQLHFHDGTNMLNDDNYPTKGSLILKVPQRKVIEHLPFEEGSLAFITGGSHVSEQGHIREIRVQKSSRPNIVVIENSDGNRFETVEHYVYVIGKDKPAIQMGTEK